MTVSEHEKLKSTCMGCRKCPLFSTRTNVVFACGNPEAKIMFVGEGPGEQEDKTGEPFVGKSGQLLDKYLKLIDLDRRTNIYITNIVKCRPPRNRDPEPQEQEICIDYLRGQVRAIRPKIIVCLGRIAAQKLISPTFRVSADHGKFTEKGGIIFMATFHPSALLRNESNKPLALADFQVLREKIRELNLLDEC
ncbi:MAG: uracil-DNA glycosylase [Oscillospiraceae bacterium]|nr:uracil-DNA glycosylase [Oscillospiraceae bacterium]